MSDLDPKDYLTIPQVAKKLKMPRRSLYRVMERLGMDKVSTLIFGRRVIHVTMLAAIKAEHAPMGSDRRHEIAVMYGAMGGETKAINLARRAKRSRSSS